MRTGRLILTAALGVLVRDAEVTASRRHKKCVAPLVQRSGRTQDDG